LPSSVLHYSALASVFRSRRTFDFVIDFLAFDQGLPRTLYDFDRTTASSNWRLVIAAKLDGLFRSALVLLSQKIRHHVFI
jgi:hypothetical protein